MNEITNEAIRRWRAAYRTLGADIPDPAKAIDTLAQVLADRASNRPALRELEEATADPKLTPAKLAKLLDASATEAVAAAGARSDLEALRPVLEARMVEALAAGVPGMIDAVRPRFNEAAGIVTKGVSVGIDARGFMDKARLLDNTDALMMFDPVRAASDELDGIAAALGTLYQTSDQTRFRVVAGGRLFVAEDPEAIAARAAEDDITIAEARSDLLDDIAHAAAHGRAQGRWIALASIRGVRLELQDFNDLLLNSARDDFRRTAKARQALAPVAIAGM